MKHIIVRQIEGVGTPDTLPSSPTIVGWAFDPVTVEDQRATEGAECQLTLNPRHVTSTFVSTVTDPPYSPAPAKTWSVEVALVCGHVYTLHFNHEHLLARFARLAFPRDRVPGAMAHDGGVGGIFGG